MAENAPTSASTLTGNTTTIEHTSAAQTYDILPKLIPHLDRHLIFPLLDALPASEGTKAKYELLKQTNMAQYLLSLWQEMNDSDDTPAEFTKKQEKVSETYDTLNEQTSALSALLDDESVISNFRADKVANLRYLEENHSVNVEQVDKLYEFGRFNYSCGNYGAAALQLGQFRILSTDNDKVSAATWGKLACDILSANWEDVMEEINKVRESIDTKLFNNPLSQLENRTWLIHWALFPLFNYEPAREVLTDILFTPNFINTIQTNCPWILRYLAAAVINNRNKAKNTGVYQKQVKDLTRAIRQELYEYRDPITDFIVALNVDFDFEEAQKKLVEAEKLMQGDFFLSPSTEMFIESARHLISESYCRIHQRIDIKDLSARLGLGQDEGEKWIVNLIRDTRVDAKIDYKEGTVVMNHPPQSVYQQIIERTKGIQFRTALLSQSVSS